MRECQCRQQDASVSVGVQCVSESACAGRCVVATCRPSLSERSQCLEVESGGRESGDSEGSLRGKIKNAEKADRTIGDRGRDRTCEKETRRRDTLIVATPTMSRDFSDRMDVGDCSSGNFPNYFWPSLQPILSPFFLSSNSTAHARTPAKNGRSSWYPPALSNRVARGGKFEKGRSASGIAGS